MIYNGYDIAKFNQDDSIEEDPFTMLTMGGVNIILDIPNNGFSLFTETARRDRQPQPSIIVINGNVLND